MQLSQPTLKPHSLYYTCWVQVVYSLLPTLLFSSCSFWGYSTAAQFPATRRSSPGATRSTRTSRQSSPSRRPCGAQLQREFRTCSTLPHNCTRLFVINVIYNIRTHFIISFYVICAMIYYSFCCIYVWLDPGTYMIARFMSFYKPGVTRSEPGRDAGLVWPTLGVGRPHLSAVWSYPLHAGWHVDPRPYPLVQIPWRPHLLWHVGPLCKGVTPDVIFCVVVRCLLLVFVLFRSCSSEMYKARKQLWSKVSDTNMWVRHVVFFIIEYSWRVKMALKHRQHPFDLAIAPGVCYRGIVDVDAAFLVGVPKFRAREWIT